jgi:protein-disulfide isomerase
MNDGMKAGAMLAVAGAMLMATLAFAAPNAPEPALDKKAIEKIVHDYLLKHPEMLVEMSNALDAKNAAETQKNQQDALAKLSKGTLLDPKVSYVSGPADAKVTLVEFFDYRCVHCKNSLPAMQKVVANNQTRVVFIEHPILTPDSLVAARAAVAARRQKDKYVPFHFALMQTNGDLPIERILQIAKDAGLNIDKLKKDMDDPAVAESVNASGALAERLHVDGTPTFIIGNKVVSGELTYDEMQKLINEAKS